MRKLVEVLTVVVMLFNISPFCIARAEGQITNDGNTRTKSAALLIANETEKKEADGSGPVAEQANQMITTEVQETMNTNLDFQIELTPVGGAEGIQYPIALHERKNGQNPSCVLISGLIFAPKGTEIRNADVQASQTVSRSIPANEIYRFQTEIVPSNLSSLSYDSDRNRAAFAFFVNLDDAGITDGSVPLTVELHVFDGETLQTAKISTNAVIDRQAPSYATVESALQAEKSSGTAAEKQTASDETNDPNASDAETKDESENTDEASPSEAGPDLPAENEDTPSEGAEGENNETGITDGNGTGENQRAEVSEQSETGGFLGFLNQPVSLLQMKLKMWMIIAAGAGLVIIILIIVLLITGKKRKKNSVEGQAFGSTGTFITDPNNDSPQASDSQPMGPILSIGDEPTVDLDSTLRSNIVVEKDAATVEYQQPIYTIKLRLIYGQKYRDQDVQLLEQGKSVIGRGEEANIQTNPSDLGVSHAHGSFEVKNDMVVYTDTSRNGTRYNGARILHSGESVTIPFNTRTEMDIGGHKILIFAAKDQ